MPRKSRQLQASKDVTGTSVSPNDAGNTNEDCHEDASAGELELAYYPVTPVTVTVAKRAKKRAVTRHKSRGKLRQMLDMPLDVIMEICSHLHPRDLLHLARISKDLRRFFMSRKSASFWQVARHTVTELPPCPANLSEPAYANLMFDAHCHSCLKQHCQDVYWRCRVRLCKICYQDSRVWRDPCNARLDREVQHPTKLPCLETILPSLDDEHQCFYMPQYLNLVSTLQAASPNDRAAFLSSRQQLVIDVEKDVPNLSHYFHIAKDMRSSELEQIRERRRESIIAKLKEDRYEEEIDFMLSRPWDYGYEFDRLPEVRKTQLLTPRIWGNIKAAVVIFMEFLRERREYHRVKSILTKRLNVLEKTLAEIASEHFPLKISPVDAALRIPELYHEWLHPNIADFEADSFQRFLKEFIPRYLEQRTINAKQSFVMITRERLGLDSSVDPFDLALATYFTCPHCTCTQALPHALYHQCTSYKVPKAEWAPQHYYNILQEEYVDFRACPSIWPPEILGEKGTEQLETIINVCGFDVKTATAAELDRADVRLQCPTYRPAVEGMPIMKWRTACRFRCHPSPSFTVATEQQIALTRPLEAEALQVGLRKHEEHYAWTCAHCTTFKLARKSAVKQHLLMSHNIEHPTEYDWIDRTTSVRVADPVFIVWRKKGEKSLQDHTIYPNRVQVIADIE